MLNNDGYASIRSTQKAYFDGRYVASGPDSGLTLPDIIKVAAAYGLPTAEIRDHSDIRGQVRRILDQEGPVVCDVHITPNQTTAPRVSSRQRADGMMESAPMEDLWPFLDRDDFRRQMLIETENELTIMNARVRPATAVGRKCRRACPATAVARRYRQFQMRTRTNHADRQVQSVRRRVLRRAAVAVRSMPAGGPSAARRRFARSRQGRRSGGLPVLRPAAWCNSTASRSAYYKDVIRAAAVSPEMGEFRSGQFRGFVERFGLQGKKVIEIGCGRGEYLSIMQQCGVRAYGVEHSKSSVEQCTAAGLAVSCGFVEGGDCRLAEAPFDAFFILNFLEHLPRPTATLAGIANLLAPEAVGLVEVPNFDMVLRTKLFAEFIADHLFYFTKETLATTLRLGGFEVLDCTRSVARLHDFCYREEEEAALDLSPFREQMTQLRAGIESYLRRFAAGRVAVWGAGHQALALIALLGLAERIAYVVDSAPFKQGKFTPATHVPIVSPETLDTQPGRRGDRDGGELFRRSRPDPPPAFRRKSGRRHFERFWTGRGLDWTNVGVAVALPPPRTQRFQGRQCNCHPNRHREQ